MLPAWAKGAKGSRRLLALPGMHANLAGNSYLNKNAQVTSPWNTEGSGRIARYWATECLTRWGTGITRTSLYSDRQLYELYELMQRRESEFRKMRDYSYTGLKQGQRQIYAPELAAG